MSNPDSHYKSYFRDSYDAFAIASDTHLKWIRKEGLKERYQCSHASKILVPKPSGTLRPITLLTVDDQIVYQACVNLIADELKRETIKRYEKSVFAHLYAGKTSQFFHKKWEDSYRKFAGRIRTSHAAGYHYVANFDLAAFYDSIDHHVLQHFLKIIGISEDTIEFLLDCLKTWTSTTWSAGPINIYHGHGIPQGPLSSGMLSEAVLMHMDKAGEQGSKTIYLRYVDDIKLLAKTEGELRRKLIKLDITAKEIGLFPQTAKINIRKILNPNEEVKSVSHPSEPALRPVVDQEKLIDRILQLTRNGKISSGNSTRFKYLLGHARPTYRLNERILKILTKHPEFTLSICSYIAKYKKIPPKLAGELSNYICGVELYHSVNGAILLSCFGRMPKIEAARVGKFCSDRLIRPKKGSIPTQPSYREGLIAWGVTTGNLTLSEYEKLIFSETDWWVQERGIREIDQNIFGSNNYAVFTNRCLRVKGGGLARMAASRLLQHGIKISRPYGDVEEKAKHTLRAAGVIKSVGQPESRINEILKYILNRPITAYQWKRFFGADHRHAERMMIFIKRNRETNIDAFLVQLDSFCDFVAAEIYKRLKPGKKYPPYGHAIKDATLTATLPNMMAAFLKLHAIRLQSTTAHPRSLKTGSPTRRLKHRDFYNMRADLVAAFDEFERVILP